MKDQNKKKFTYLVNRLNRIAKMVRAQNKDWLTIAELMKEFSISRKTFDRMRQRGLEVWQPIPNGKILVNRNEFINFLNVQK